MNTEKYQGYYRTTKTPDWYDSSATIPTTELTKTYLGIVKDTRDPQKMGRIQVWIPELTGDANKVENWIMCSYCSPFAGATFFDIGIHKDIGNDDSVKELGKLSSDRTPEMKDQPFYSGRQSYGMWFVPPDIGNEVLITFINGDPSRAVWFGCLFQQDTNHMVPGIAQDLIFAGEDTVMDGEVGPVIEHDSRSGFNPDAPKRKKYCNLRDSLKFQQGLDKDGSRGQSTSSAQREAPSEVFGILTPDGNSFVMDDKAEEELIRFRTKSGVQLLLHQTTGFIYVISKNGKTWIELSNDGDIDIYGQANISIHAETGNINLKASGATSDINIQAGQDINIRADRNINIVANASYDMNVAEFMTTTVGSAYNLKVEDTIVSQSGGSIHMNAALDVAVNAGSQIGLTAVGDLFEEAENIFMNSGPGPQATVADEAEFPETYAIPGPATKATDISSWESGEPYADGVNIIPRVPQHEPWSLHTTEVIGVRGHIPEGEPTGAKDGQLPGSAADSPPQPVNTPEGKRLEDGRHNAAGEAEYATVTDLPPEALTPASQHQVSEKGIALIKQFEGNGLDVYQDVAGLDTVGVGHLITDEEKASGRFADGRITEEESTELLLEDLASIQKQVRGCVKQNLTQEQYDALVSMAFNIGGNAFCNSTLVKKLNAGNFVEVPNEMGRWTKANINGTLTPVQGLVNRRQAEARLFATAPSTA